MTVSGGGRTVRSLRLSTRRANRTYRLRLRSRGRRRGTYTVTLVATGPSGTVRIRLKAARI